MQNKLFREIQPNILPCLGEAIYHGPVLTEKEAYMYFTVLKNQIPWEKERLKIAGKAIQMQRMVAWFGDNNYSYSYSGTIKIALPWTHELLKLKTLAQDICSEKYNSCLLNYYPDGNSGMGWHSDDERSIVEDSSIASISLGAERKFSLKQKTGGDSISVLLENGSLLEMKGQTQNNWLHALPKFKKITEPRINLTFRLMKE
jgi:alkylated DNA repair dioxygenase AlkB